MRQIRKYVKTVEQFLPKDRRIETAGELYATLLSKVREREKDLGRKPTSEEIEQIVQGFGAPEDVAARYNHDIDNTYPMVGRYVGALARQLDGEGVEDILAEVREALTSRLEAREEILGRTLNTQEVSGELKDFGPPIVVASRYQERQNLIGQDLFPYYWPALKAALAVGGAIIFVRAILALFAQASAHRVFIQTFVGFCEFAVFAFGAVTLAFFVLDRTSLATKLTEAWDPESLPNAAISRPKSLFESVLAVSFDAVFIAWWMGRIDFSGMWAGNHEPSFGFEFSQAWEPFHVPILVLACLSFAIHAIDIARPGWSPLRSIMTALGYASGVAIIAMLLGDRPLLDITILNESSRTEKLAESLLTSFHVTLGISAVIYAFCAFSALLKFLTAIGRRAENA